MAGCGVYFSTNMFIKKPEDFNFRATIYSHGWYQLAPFKLDEEQLSLNYVFQNKEVEKPVSAKIFETAKELKIEFSDKKLSDKSKQNIAASVQHIFQIDEDLSGFYELLKEEKDFAWIAEAGAGRLLRSPTVFEDLIKTICTTNCSWALTKNMVANLVDKLGVETENGEKTFPTPEALGSVDAEFYRREIRAGYRSEYFAELAEQISSGIINPEKWLETDLPTAELKKEMKKIKGVGNYAAENLLKLVGRYDGLALDSFLRSGFYKKHNNGISCTDKEIEKFYARFGEWRGLVIWFDISKR